MTEQELLLKADEFIEANMEDIIRDIKAVVDIPSVKSEAKEGAPFGVEVRRALGKAHHRPSGCGAGRQRMEHGSL